MILQKRYKRINQLCVPAFKQSVTPASNSLNQPVSSGSIINQSSNGTEQEAQSSDFILERRCGSTAGLRSHSTISIHAAEVENCQVRRILITELFSFAFARKWTSESSDLIAAIMRKTFRTQKQ